MGLQALVGSCLPGVFSPRNGRTRTANGSQDIARPP